MQSNISNLKQHLSENLAKVKEGETITILERSTPIAKIVPVKKAARPRLVMRKPEQEFIDLKLNIRLKTDPIEYILSERGER